MYELLLKWGLDSLSKFAGIKGKYELDVIQEAIRTKNSIIIERYKKCWELYEDLVDLTLDIEKDLETFVKNTEETDGTWKSARKFIGTLRADFHPAYYRRFLKIRCTFEGTNDLISSYTFVFSEITNIDTLVAIAKKKKIYSRGDICRLYRGLWTKYSEIVAILLRVTSCDLRFWVTDTPYVRHTDEWAKTDLALTLKFFNSASWQGQRLHISLETGKGLDRFWLGLEEHHKNQDAEQSHPADPE